MYVQDRADRDKDRDELVKDKVSKENDALRMELKESMKARVEAEASRADLERQGSENATNLMEKVIGALMNGAFPRGPQLGNFGGGGDNFVQGPSASAALTYQDDGQGRHSRRRNRSRSRKVKHKPPPPPSSESDNDGSSDSTATPASDAVRSKKKRKK